MLFVGNVLLARAVSTSTFGLYAYVIELVALGAVLALVGFDQNAIRIIPALVATNERRALRRFICYGLVVAVGSVGLLSIVMTWAWYRGAMPANMTAGTLALVLLLLFGLCVLRFAQESLRARHRIALSQIIEQFIWPAILTIFAAMALVFDFGATVQELLVLQVAVFLIGGGCLFAAFARIPLDTSAVELQADARETPSAWLRSGAALALAAAMSVFLNRGDLLALGSTHSSDQLAPYVAASRYAALLVLGLGAASAAGGASMRRQWSGGDHGALQDTVDRTTGISVLFALPLALVFIFFPAWPLSLYGAPYIAGAVPLRLLVLAQAVNVATGPVATLVIVCDQVRPYFIIMASCVGLFVLSLWLLVPRAGSSGAALAVLLSLSVLNIALARILFMRTGIRSWLTPGCLRLALADLASLARKAMQ